MNRSTLHQRFSEVRSQSEALVAPLEVEDWVVQSMEDASPVKWNLGHVTWFFETFLLRPYLPGWTTYSPHYEVLFNSYYQTVGPQYSRPHRGVLSRPTVDEVCRYRRTVDSALHELIDCVDNEQLGEVFDRLELGLQHEQQHQELLLTDLKHAFSKNPLEPAYAVVELGHGESQGRQALATRWLDFEGGLVELGHAGDGFGFDHEFPRHRCFLEPFRLADRPVSNREWMTFMEDGGYRRAELWLSEGWAEVQRCNWTGPLYWGEDGTAFSLGGRRPIELDESISHVSHFEADAFARWAGARLPTEQEWEYVASQRDTMARRGALLEDGVFHPAPFGGYGAIDAIPRVVSPDPGNTTANRLLGDVWEWTQSAYLPYPGYQALPGALGEYNGKFMSGQIVLRGGSCFTPQTHIRPTYRNFFPPSKRWQMSGLRLARTTQH